MKRKRQPVIKTNEKPADYRIETWTDNRWAEAALTSYRGAANASLAEHRDEGHIARLVKGTKRGQAKVLIAEDQTIPDHPGTLSSELEEAPAPKGP